MPRKTTFTHNSRIVNIFPISLRCFVSNWVEWNALLTPHIYILTHTHTHTLLHIAIARVCVLSIFWVQRAKGSGAGPEGHVIIALFPSPFLLRQLLTRKTLCVRLYGAFTLWRPLLFVLANSCIHIHTYIFYDPRCCSLASNLILLAGLAVGDPGHQSSISRRLIDCH